MFTEVMYEEKLDVEDDCVPAECIATKEYSLFKKLQGNRPVSDRHVRNLMESLKRENLLKFQPILVNENFEIVDGQHRLEAAKRLGVHIHFTVKTGSTYKTSGVLNYAMEEWNFSNHLDNYIKNGHAAYIKLGEFIDKYNVSLRRFRYLVSEKQLEIFDKTFKSGEFKIIDNLLEISHKIQSIDRIISFLNNILLLEKKRFLFTDSFWRALYIMLIKNDVDIDRFLEKLEIKRQSVRPLTSYKEYLRLLTDIYNWKTKKQRITLRELKESY